MRSSQNFVQARKTLCQIIINMEVTDVLVSEIQGEKMIKNLIYDLRIDKQLLYESQFILWKFLALIRYCDLDIENYIVSSGSLPISSLESKRVFIDLLSIINFLNLKFLTSERSFDQKGI